MALITPKQVIDTAFTNKNTDQYLVKPAFVEIAELNFIQPSLGEKLYKNLTEEFNRAEAWVWDDLYVKTTIGSNRLTVTNIQEPPIPIAVNDFITGQHLPIYDSGNGSDRGLNKITKITLEAGVNYIYMSGVATEAKSGIRVKVRRPFSVLLEDYILDYLAFCVKFEMLPDMSYNTTSQGVVENVAEFTMPVDSKKLNFLRNETFKKSETYLRRMIDFLSNNDEAYPDWDNELAGGVSKFNGIILY